MSTLVIQSHRTPLPYEWLGTCLQTVRAWCADYHFDYRFLGDELFDLLSESIRVRFEHRTVVLSDLARLKAIQAFLGEGYERVVWLDADVLIFRPEEFVLPGAGQLPERYMLGREIWVQPRADKPNKLQAYKKVHNAFLLFDQHNSFLDFYTDQAERMLSMAEPTVPSQFIGPKLLTALHNIIACPVMESVGMLSPRAIQDLLSDGQQTCALNLLSKRSGVPMVAANLCGSSVESGAISSEQMALICEILMQPTVCL